MAHRFEVAFKPGVKDGPGARAKKQIEALGLPVESVNTVQVFTVDRELYAEHRDLLCKELFADPIIQDAVAGRPINPDDGFDWLIEVAFQPGAKDTEGETAEHCIRTITGLDFRPDEKVYTSMQYRIKGDLDEKGAHAVAGMLANETVQFSVLTDSKAFRIGEHNVPVPKVKIKKEPTTEHIDLNLSGEALARKAREINEERRRKNLKDVKLETNDDWLLFISQDRRVALNLQEMRSIKDYFSGVGVIEERMKLGLSEMPTDAEIEVIGQTWSEHCKHKIFNARVEYNGQVIDSLFKTFIKSSTETLRDELGWVVSTLWDNSGVMEFNDKYYFCFKCETHNSPSNEYPYGGAYTGIAGVYRDPMGTGMGAKLAYGTYWFCTGYPDYNGELMPKIHPGMLLEGVRKGVEDGGNRHGVPTPFGGTWFDDGYMGKPAIYVLAAGLIDKEVAGRPGYEKEAEPGDLIVMIGGRVGIDGIHGATESSMEAGEWITAGHVQIGDSYTQKKMHEFLRAARERGLYRCITDNGAGGLSSSVGEMGNNFGRPGGARGFKVDLKEVPLKYQGLMPWQILVSEAQERMTVDVPKDKRDEFLELARMFGVEATVLGEFTNTGKYHVTYGDETVVYMDMDFVHGGVPQMNLKAAWIEPEEGGLYEPGLPEIEHRGSFLKQMLARPNIASKEYIIRQFDHEVQGTSVIKQLVGESSDVNSDGVVIRPDLESFEGIAITAGINPKYSQIDTYHMTACALDEAIRRVIAVGGSLKQIALNDNFCWPSPLPGPNNPDAEYKMAQLVRANQALHEYTLAFKTPCISGKDSMSMDGTIKDKDGREHRVSAPPAIQFSAAGKIEDVRKCVTMDVKKPGDIVYVLGLTKDECGASEFYEMMGHVGLNVPQVDAEKSVRRYNALSQAVEEGLFSSDGSGSGSIHGCYRGGLGVALAQTSFAGGYGLDVELSAVPMHGLENIDKILGSESAGRFVVTVSPENQEMFEGIMEGNDYAPVGRVTDDKTLTIKWYGRDILKENIYELKETWQAPFRQEVAA